MLLKMVKCFVAAFSIWSKTQAGFQYNKIKSDNDTIIKTETLWFSTFISGTTFPEDTSKFPHWQRKERLQQSLCTNRSCKSVYSHLKLESHIYKDFI